VEAVNKGWSLDIDESFEPVSSSHTNGISGDAPKDSKTSRVVGGAIEAYEETIRDPGLDALQATATEANGLKLEVSSLDTQSFLATQLEVLDKIQQGAEASGMDSSRLASGRQLSQPGIETSEGRQAGEGRVNEHIGPVQFNMGGIQVDADDMLQRLKVQYLIITNFLHINADSSNSGPTKLPNARA